MTDLIHPVPMAGRPGSSLPVLQEVDHGTQLVCLLRQLQVWPAPRIASHGVGFHTTTGASLALLLLLQAAEKGQVKTQSQGEPGICSEAVVLISSAALQDWGG